MNHRILASLGVMPLVLGVAISASAQAQKTTPAPAAKPATAKVWTVGRTPDGQPDLQGYWTNNSYTPLQRPNGVTKEFYTVPELREAEKKAAEREEEQTVPGTVA